MLAALQQFFLQRINIFWFLEISILSISWVILRTNGSLKESFPLPFLVEFALFLPVLIGLNLLCSLISRHRIIFIVLWQISAGFAAALYLHFFSGYQRNTNLLLWAAQFTAQLSITAIAGQCSMLYGMIVQQGTAQGIIRISIYLLLILLAVFLRRLNFDEYEAVPKGGLRLIVFGTICLLFLYIFETRLSVEQDSRIITTLLLAYLCMFGMVLGSIRVLYVMCREHAAMLDLRAEKQRLQSEHEFAKHAETTLENLRCIRHDLKNQYAYMQILLSEKRYTELQEYFSSLSEHLPAQLNIVDCGNSTVNTVLNMIFSRLRTENIHIEHQLVVPPILPFADDDICAIIGNTLDNAEEECCRLIKSGKEDANIRLEIYPHQSYLYINCNNSTDRIALDRTKGGLLTTKGDKQLHGYGTKIITKLAEKYNGAAVFSIADGRFAVQIMLDLTEGNHDD